MMRSLFKYLITRILRVEAEFVLRKYEPRRIAVTGSVGKTTTKDAIYAVLSARRYVRKSEKSYNSELGIPLTILGCESGWTSPTRWARNIWEGVVLLTTKNHYPRLLVLEVGADRPGDIREAAQWLKPDIAVITRLPDVPVHVEFFESPEAVAREKWALAEHLAETGILVINVDDGRLAKRARYARNPVITYGFSDAATIRATHMQYISTDNAPSGMTFRVDYNDASVPVTIYGVVGKHIVYSALAAIAVACAEGISLVAAGEALAAFSPPPGRMRICAGVNGSTLIDDTYNSSPIAAHGALATLKDVKVAGRRIAVLGDMLELGAYTTAEHRSLGMYAAEVVDVLVTIGVRSRHIAEAAREAGMKEDAVFECRDTHEAAEALKEILIEGDVALIKASESIRAERVVAACLAEPDRAGELLVRQDADWLAR